MFRLALAVLAVLACACSSEASPGADETVRLTLYVPGVGKLSAEYACPGMGEPNGAFGRGPKPSFQTLAFRQADKTFVVSTQAIPDRFCVANSYTGQNISGPFNVFEISPAGDGRYWFRDHGDNDEGSQARPLQLVISSATADRTGAADAAKVQVYPGSISLVYRSGLVIPVAFWPRGERISSEDHLAALALVRSNLRASAELTRVSAEEFCDTLGDSLSATLSRLPEDDIRKELLRPYVGCASPGLSKTEWPPAISAIETVIGKARPMHLGPSNEWRYDHNFARGEGVLVACTIDEEPCVDQALSAPEVPLRAADLITDRQVPVEYRPDHVAGVTAFYDRRPDGRDVVIFVSNALHNFNLSGVEP